MPDKGEQAQAVFGQGFNCAQAVLAPFAEKYGLPMPMAMKVAGGLGGGLRCGEVCGAASGGVLVVGLAYGQADAADTGAKQRCREKTMEFMAAFKAQNGALRCADLLGHDPATPEGAEAIKQLGLHQSVCQGLVAGAATLLEEMGY